MKNLLIVSPFFPPSSTPDLQRVRMSLPYYAEFGWAPFVLAVEPRDANSITDELLLSTVPGDLAIRRVRALPLSWTRKVGIGELGLRSFISISRAGAQVIAKRQIDLAFFSTTVFPIMAVGRIWKTLFGTPYVLDIQDPWYTDYYDHKPKAARPPKYKLAQLMHRTLEPFAMKSVDGIIAVSQPYHETLRRRYPWIREDLCSTIPFGACESDYLVAKKATILNRYYDKSDRLIHGVYVGALGKAAKSPTCEVICGAFKLGLAQFPDLFSNVRLHFIGTDYAVGAKGQLTIRPIADALGIGSYISEHAARVPYFEALKLLQDADFLLAPGSDNPQYTASKIYPYILARKPLLTLFHEESSVVQVVKSTNAGEAVSFSSHDSIPEIERRLMPVWTKLLQSLPYTPNTNWDAFSAYEAHELTRQQCQVFDQVLQSRSA